MSRLLLLNGPPGIGKSTLARRYVADHPGVLNCDIDVLRTLIGGWESDFAAAGGLIRPAALAMIEAYLAHGHDVVLPQMLTNPTEVARFEASATAAGAQLVERFLMDTPAASAARFHRRGTDAGTGTGTGTGTDDPWHDQVRSIVAANGGDEALARSHEALERLLPQRPAAVVVTSVEGKVDETYRSLLESLG